MFRLVFFTLCCRVENDSLESSRHSDPPPAAPHALHPRPDPCWPLGPVTRPHITPGGASGPAVHWEMTMIWFENYYPILPVVITRNRKVTKAKIFITLMWISLLATYEDKSPWVTGRNVRFHFDVGYIFGVSSVPGWVSLGGLGPRGTVWVWDAPGCHWWLVIDRCDVRLSFVIS